MSKKNYTDVLLEEMNGKFDLLLEAISPLKDMQNDMFLMKEDISELKTDVKIIKAEVTDTNVQVIEHEARITELEAA